MKQEKLKSYLMDFLKGLLKQWEHQMSSKMIDYEAEEMMRNNEFLKTKTCAEMKLTLLILIFEESRPWCKNLPKEERRKVQMKAVRSFWAQLKNESDEEIGNLPKQLFECLKIWQEMTEKAESDTEILLRSIGQEWKFLDKLDRCKS